MNEAELGAIADFAKIRIIWALGLWATSAELLGAKWFYEMFAWVVSNLKKLVESEETQQTSQGAQSADGLA